MPKHDFLLLPETDGNYADYMQHFNSPDAVKVDDNILVRTILDTLSWIPTINPANPEEWQGYGLNYYGPTVINKAGAAKASRIFHLWAELLEEGPEELELTGSYEWNEGEDLSTGRYARFTVRRDTVVTAFLTIAGFADKAASGRFYVLHLGI